MTLKPKIYVACLSAYNSGRLHGCWIDAALDVDDIYEEINTMLENSPASGAKEWTIHDYQDFGDINLSEYKCIETVTEVAEMLIEHGEVFIGVCQYYDNFREAKRVIEEDYQGEWDSLTSWAEDIIEDTGQLLTIPENLRYCFDYEKYARDAELSGDIFTIENGNGLHVFWNR